MDKIEYTLLHSLEIIEAIKEEVRTINKQTQKYYLPSSSFFGE